MAEQITFPVDGPVIVDRIPTNPTLPNFPDISPLRPPISAINQAASFQTEYPTDQAAKDMIAPIVYGEAFVRCRPILWQDRYDQVYWLIPVADGPNEAIDTLIIGEDEYDVPGGSGAVAINGTPAQVYPGSAGQDISAVAGAWVPGFSDTYENTAVISYPAKVTTLSGALSIDVIMRGRNDVDDIRGPTTGYTSNPSLCFAHWVKVIVNSAMTVKGFPVFTIPDQDIIDCANWNDETVRTIGLVIDQQREWEDIADLIAEHANLIWWKEGNQVRMRPDAPSARVGSLNDTQHIEVGSIRVINGEPELREIADNIETLWFDVAERRVKSAFAKPPTPGEVVLQKRMSGIGSHDQADRESTETWNHQNLEPLAIEFKTRDEGLRYERADVIGVGIHRLAIRDISCRLSQASLAGPGQWKFKAVLYDEAAYSQDIQQPTTDNVSSYPSASSIPVAVVQSVTVDEFVPPDRFSATLVLEHPEWIHAEFFRLQIWKDDESEQIGETRDLPISGIDTEVSPGPPRIISTKIEVPREFSFKVRVAVVNNLGNAGDYSAFVASTSTIDNPAIPTLLLVTKVTSGPQFGAGELVGYEVTEYGLEWDNVSWGYEGTYICQLYDSATGEIAAESILKPSDLTIGGGTSSMSFGQVNADNNEYEARVAIQAIYGQVGDFNNATIDDHTPELIIIFVPPPSYAAVTDGVLVTIPNGTIDEGTREYKFEYRETSGSGLTVFGVAKSEQFLDTIHTGASLPYSYRVTMVRRGGTEISSTETLT